MIRFEYILTVSQPVFSFLRACGCRLARLQAARKGSRAVSSSCFQCAPFDRVYLQIAENYFALRPAPPAMAMKVEMRLSWRLMGLPLIVWRRLFSGRPRRGFGVRSRLSRRGCGVARGASRAGASRTGGGAVWTGAWGWGLVETLELPFHFSKMRSGTLSLFAGKSGKKDQQDWSNSFQRGHIHLGWPLRSSLG